MLMLDFLRLLQENHPFHLHVCHVNHMIRAGEADLDEALVRDYCRQHRIPVTVFKADAPAYAREHKTGLEEAGRRLRRDCYTKVGEEVQQEMGTEPAYRIALAHHLDDRAESIIMHMGRGTGLGGLAGIRYRDGRYIRPLLDLRRKDVEQAARAMALAWREDASNLSDRFLRNRVRNQLLPLWEEVFGHDPAPLLVRLGDLAREDDRELSAQALRHLEESLLPDGSLSLPDLQKLPRPLAGRLLQLFAQGGGGEERTPYLLSERQIDSLLELCQKVARGEMPRAGFDLPGGRRALISRSWILINGPERPGRHI